MSILDQAREAADKQRQKAEQEAAADAANDAFRHGIVDQMEAMLFEELDKLDGQQTKHGVLHLDRTHDHSQIVAYLRATDQRDQNHMVAWFKAGVVSGTYDASDDCRDIPYTSCRVSARFYPPEVGTRRRTWDIQELEMYHGGGWTWSCSSLQEMPKFFSQVAEQLARWM
jgi:hypothetical protein